MTYDSASKLALLNRIESDVNVIKGYYLNNRVVTHHQRHKIVSWDLRNTVDGVIHFNDEMEMKEKRWRY